MTTMATAPGNVTTYTDQPELKQLRVSFKSIDAFSICVLSLVIESESHQHVIR